MRRSHALLLLIAVLLLTIATGCPRPDRDRPDREPNPDRKPPGRTGPAQPQDGRVVEGGGDWKDNREVLSPLILRAPLYECTKVVWVSGFIPGAEVLLFEGSNPIGGGIGQFSAGQQFNVTISFVKGQVITARQKFNGVTGSPSNAVTVRRASEDYPSGIPKPAIVPPPLFNCGLAIGATDFVAGAEVAARSEAALGGGGFGPITTIGSSPMASPYPGGWMTISPAYTLGARVTLQYKICADTSPASNPQIVQAQPAITPPTIDDAVYEGGRIVVVRNILNGALLTVKAGATQIGQSPTPGGSGQQLWITPAATSGATLTATQKLCDQSGPSPGVPVHPCSALPAAIIKQPQPGDDRVEVISFIPGARIIILAGGVEIGDGGPPIVPLTRPLNNDEELTVIQMIGECRSRFVHVIVVRCPFGDNPLNCSADWPMFRQNPSRNALQSKPSVLTTPDLVRVLKVKPGWPFRPSGAVAFRASPVVFNGKVYIGNGNGLLRHQRHHRSGGVALPAHRPAGPDVAVHVQSVELRHRRQRHHRAHPRQAGTRRRRRDLRRARPVHRPPPRQRAAVRARRRDRRRDLEVGRGSGPERPGRRRRRAARADRLLVAGGGGQPRLRRHRQPLRQPHPERQGRGGRCQQREHRWRVQLPLHEHARRRRLELRGGRRRRRALYHHRQLRQRQQQRAVPE
jgi:hypothetical protein